MPNSNPITKVDTGKYPVFFIPENFADKALLITTKTKMVASGWHFAIDHTLSVDGDPVPIEADPDINNLRIGTCRELHGKKFSLVSIVSRFRDGGDENLPNVEYSLTFRGDKQNVIEEFSLNDITTNPVTFYTKITLMVAS